MRPSAVVDKVMPHRPCPAAPGTRHFSSAAPIGETHYRIGEVFSSTSTQSGGAAVPNLSKALALAFTVLLQRPLRGLNRPTLADMLADIGRRSAGATQMAGTGTCVLNTWLQISSFSCSTYAMSAYRKLCRQYHRRSLVTQLATMYPIKQN